MNFIRIEDFYKCLIKPGDASAQEKILSKKLSCGQCQQNIKFVWVKVGYGEKVYFRCPICGSLRTRLYFDRGLFRCVDCCQVKPYSGIQNSTKGGYSFLEYKMERFAQRCGIGEFTYPFDYALHPKPKHKHYDKWERNLKIMQALENMRTQSIFFQKIWKPAVIKSVEKGQNSLLKGLNLYWLRENLYNFDNGV